MSAQNILFHDLKFDQSHSLHIIAYQGPHPYFASSVGTVLRLLFACTSMVNHGCENDILITVNSSSASNVSGTLTTPQGTSTSAWHNPAGANTLQHSQDVVDGSTSGLQKDTLIRLMEVVSYHETQLLGRFIGTILPQSYNRY